MLENDINNLVINRISSCGGTDADLDVWHKVFNDINSFCDFAYGSSDDYTRDMFLCWSAWVIKAPRQSVEKIYDAIKDFNVFIDDNSQHAASQLNKMHKGILDNAKAPIDIMSGLAINQLNRQRALQSGALSMPPKIDEEMIIPNDSIKTDIISIR